MKNSCNKSKTNRFVSVVVEITEIIMTRKPPHAIVLITSFSELFVALLNFVISQGYDVILITGDPLEAKKVLNIESHQWKSFLPKTPTGIFSRMPTKKVPLQLRKTSSSQQNHADPIIVADENDELLIEGEKEKRGSLTAEVPDTTSSIIQSEKQTEIQDVPMVDDFEIDLNVPYGI